jgi:indolepyruvate ferredoxin oxidoreductase, alpha subunit
MAVAEKERTLLMGNEAFGRGAFEAGVTVATGYPGTPSTEILEAVAQYPEIYCEWAPNEKVALEVAIGAAMAGARTVVTMKHVGLNVAADPLMTVTYTGIKAGLVLLVADDPGMHSSQNEQDTRNYGRFAKIPVLEPSDSQEAKDFVKLGLEISEKYDTPVIVRSATRISHTKTPVVMEDRTESPVKLGFEKNPKKFIPVPMNARGMHVRVEQRLLELVKLAGEIEINREVRSGDEIGIITCGTTYQYVREYFPEASVLKLGMTWPLNVEKVRQFASTVKQLFVVEELDSIFETELKAQGVQLEGKKYIPLTGELSPEVIKRFRAEVLGLELPAIADKPDAASKPLPIRAPVLCPGCPHRGVFYALSQMDVVVTGDIGCYSLGFAPPYNAMDTIICMGASVGMMHGMTKAGLDKPVVGVIGDSTFMHTGINGLMDVVYNQGHGTLVILDNRTTAMTGHQEHPGTGKSIKGQETYEVKFEDICRACGVKRVRQVDPYDLDATMRILKEEIEAEEPSVIITSRPCALLPGQEKKTLTVEEDLCQGCLQCLDLGCPALEKYEEDGVQKVRINDVLCLGCEMCQSVCPFECIHEKEK